MFNILDFIDSPTLRRYNKSTYFTPAEQAVLIGLSERTTVEAKMAAWQDLVDNYTAEEFQIDSIRINWFSEEKLTDFRKIVMNMITIWKDTLAMLHNQANVVYELRVNEREHIRESSPSYFSSFDFAYGCAKKEIEKYRDDEYLRNVETYTVIKRIHLDEGDNEVDIFYFDDDLRMIKIYSSLTNWIDPDKIDLLEQCYMYVPTPFKKGDIVKVQSPFDATYYGVIPWDYRSLEEDVSMRVGGDSSDITLSLDVYLDDLKEFDFTDDTDILSLQYCSLEELPEEQKILIEVSKARKGEIDWFAFVVDTMGK